MPRTHFSLKELVGIYRQLSNCEWRGNRLCGDLTVNSQEAAGLLQNLLREENATDYPCLVEEGNPDNVAVGDVFRLQFGSVRTGIGLVVPDVTTLLRNAQVASGTEATAWYVVSRDVASWEDTELNRRLALVHRLVRALESTAAIFDPRKATLVFLRDGRFDVPIRYAEADLEQMDATAAEQIIADLELQDGHTAQRHEICATAVCELLAGVPTDARFAAILLRLEELRQRFVDGYKLFASSFSYEKVRDQAEALRIEYSGKIHKTLSDIQGQLLGIPISTIVVATQFKDLSTSPGQLWINIAVITGAFIFCVLLSLAVWNQFHTIGVIAEEIDRHEKLLSRDHADIAERVRHVFVGLRNRMQFHRIALAGAVIVCGVGFLIGFAVFWLLSQSAL